MSEIELLESFRDVPYMLGGVTRAGADCWGLVVLAYSARGIELPCYNASLVGERKPGSGFVSREYRRERARAWRLVARVEAEPWDVVVMRNRTPEDHVGLVLNAQRLLTTNLQHAAHFADWARGTFWGDRVEGVYRYVGA